MRTICLSLMAFCALLGACSGCEKEKESASAPTLALVGVVQITPNATADGRYKYEFKVGGSGYGDFQGAAQEMAWSHPNYAPETLIEFCSGAWFEDTRTGIEGDHFTMRVYGANAEGAVLNPVGRGLLQHNHDGSFITDNSICEAGLKAEVGVHGRVSKAGPASEWVISADPDGLRVTIDGKTQFFPKP